MLTSAWGVLSGPLAALIIAAGAIGEAALILRVSWFAGVIVPVLVVVIAGLAWFTGRTTLASSPELATWLLETQSLIFAVTAMALGGVLLTGVFTWVDEDDKSHRAIYLSALSGALTAFLTQIGTHFSEGLSLAETAQSLYHEKFQGFAPASPVPAIALAYLAAQGEDFRWQEETVSGWDLAARHTRAAAVAAGLRALAAGQ
jgi:hypothetical protein